MVSRTEHRRVRIARTHDRCGIERRFFKFAERRRTERLPHLIAESADALRGIRKIISASVLPHERSFVDMIFFAIIRLRNLARFIRQLHVFFRVYKFVDQTVTVDVHGGKLAVFDKFHGAIVRHGKAARAVVIGREHILHAHAPNGVELGIVADMPHEIQIQILFAVAVRVDVVVKRMRVDRRKDMIEPQIEFGIDCGIFTRDHFSVQIFRVGIAVVIGTR